MRVGRGAGAGHSKRAPGPFPTTSGYDTCTFIIACLNSRPRWTNQSFVGTCSASRRSAAATTSISSTMPQRCVAAGRDCADLIASSFPGGSLPLLADCVHRLGRSQSPGSPPAKQAPVRLRCRPPSRRRTCRRPKRPQLSGRRSKLI